MDQLADYLSDYVASFTFSDLPADQQPATVLDSGAPGAHRSLGRGEHYTI